MDVTTFNTSPHHQIQQTLSMYCTIGQSTCLWFHIWVLTKMAMEFTVTCDVMPCILVDFYRRSGGTCLNHTGVELMKEASSSQNTVMFMYSDHEWCCRKECNLSSGHNVGIIRVISYMHNMFSSNWLRSVSELHAATWSATPKANTCKTEQRYRCKYYSYHQHLHVWTMKTFNNNIK
jgi:hypothetical protein